jgi:hypothetical protein
MRSMAWYTVQKIRDDGSGSLLLTSTSSFLMMLLTIKREKEDAKNRRTSNTTWLIRPTATFSLKLASRTAWARTKS